MKRKCLFLMVAIAAGLLFLSTAAVALPVPGTYRTWDGTLQPGFWKDDFTGSPGMGLGGDVITAFSFTSIVTDQWLLSVTSTPATPYVSGGPTPPSLQSAWDWVTPYSGTLTIGGSLTDDGTVPFSVNATNFNVTFGKYSDLLGRPLLEWRFVGTGTYLDYVIEFEAWYKGAPYSITQLEFGDLANAIEMEMTVAKAPVPEPATMLLLGSGLMGLAGFGRKKLFKKS